MTTNDLLLFLTWAAAKQVNLCGPHMHVPACYMEGDRDNKIICSYDRGEMAVLTATAIELMVKDYFQTMPPITMATNREKDLEAAITTAIAHIGLGSIERAEQLLEKAVAR